MSERHINAAGLDLVKLFEGLRLKAYQDVAGIWTIGYGHIFGVREGDTCTKEQAEAWLEKDLHRVEEAVEKGCRGIVPPLNDNEFSALVSLAFNVGAHAVIKPTKSIQKALRRGDRKGAADAILLWNKATIDGVKREVPGLTRRREAERKLFLKKPGKLAP